MAASAMQPLEILNYAIREMGRTQAELAGLVGKTSASQLLSGSRRISLGAAQKISAAWNIPIQLLVTPYRTENVKSEKRSLEEQVGSKRNSMRPAKVA